MAREAGSGNDGGVIVGRMKLGSQGLEVSRQGLGCMGMSAFYGPPKPDTDMIALIHYAIRSGVTFFDSSDIYGPYTNEILLGKVLLLVVNNCALTDGSSIGFWCRHCKVG